MHFIREEQMRERARRQQEQYQKQERTGGDIRYGSGLEGPEAGL